MIVIPELKIILICTPKTGTTSLVTAILDKYSHSKLLHRHMEADAVPEAYSNYEKIGVFRNPIDRLWSLYNYSRNFTTADHSAWHEHIKKVRESVKNRTFNEWIVENNYPFTQPIDAQGNISAKYSVKHVIPENFKSQFIYLRPDLGTIIFHYDELHKLEEKLNIVMPKINITSYDNKRENLNYDSLIHLKEHLSWDLDFQKNYKL